MSRVCIAAPGHLGDPLRILPPTVSDSHLLSDFKDENLFSPCTQSSLNSNFYKVQSWKNESGI